MLGLLCKQHTFLTSFIRQIKFASLPEVLVVHAKKFQLVNWVPAKLGACSFRIFLSFATLIYFISLTDIRVILPPEDELLFTERHLGQGLQESETELPNESAGKHICIGIVPSRQFIFYFQAPSLPEFNEAAMAQLVSMGFPTIRCQRALLATGNNDPEAAMEWLFGHMEDPGVSLMSFYFDLLSYQLVHICRY
jgi:ubiquitin carboxyl-terminal hydrolase 5/13